MTIDAPSRPRTAPPRGSVVRGLRRAALLAILPVLGVILLGTMGPPAIAGAATGTFLEFVSRVLPGTIGYGDLQAVLNAVMFAPIGFLLTVGLRPALWPLAAAAGPLLSVGIESGQQWIPGRVSDAFDVLTNSVGSLAGFFAGVVVVGIVAFALGVGRLAAR